MATTNYSVIGNNLRLKDQFGVQFGTDSQFALVQWEMGYNPAYHPLSEWTSNPISVNWTGTYTASSRAWSSTPSQMNFDSPIYLWVNPSGSQAGLYQITDNLTLDGVAKSINLNTANIVSVVGTYSSNAFLTQDYSTWTPTAVPEPSYSSFAVALFAIAIIARRYV